jgi:hypothetical protein
VAVATIDAAAGRTFACACTAAKVILPETPENRLLERRTAIERAMRRDARRVDRQLTGTEQPVRGVDNDVVTARIGELHWRDQRRVAEVVREECTPGL